MAGDIGLAGVCPCVRPCVRASVRHSLDLRNGWTDFREILHDIGTWPKVDARLFRFSIFSKMAVWRPFLLRNLDVFTYNAKSIDDMVFVLA